MMLTTSKRAPSIVTILLLASTYGCGSEVVEYSDPKPKQTPDGENMINFPISDLIALPDPRVVVPVDSDEPEDPGIVIPPGVIKVSAPQNVIKIKFLEGVRVRLLHENPEDPESKLVPVDLDGVALTSLQALLVLTLIEDGEWGRTHIPSEEALDTLRAQTMEMSGQYMPDLNLYFSLRLPTTLNVREVISMFEALPEVERAALMPIYFLAAPDYSAYQGDYIGDVNGTPVTVENVYQRYLDAAPVGVDARFAWTVPGGDGAGVNLVLIEGGYDRNHPDLPAIAEDGIPFANGLDPKDVSHGTATLGVMVGVNNSEGVTGIAHGATPFFLSRIAMENPVGDPITGIDEALTWATDLDSLLVNHIVTGQTQPGDVIVLEVQRAGPNYDVNDIENPHRGMVPVEWSPDIHNAIKHATIHGFVVIEAAGNGEQNLNDPIYIDNPAAPHNPFKFDEAGNSVNDSGAIVVGAGYSNWSWYPAVGKDPRARMEYSNYGKRIDVQAWGDRIVTTGPGRVVTDENGAVTYDGTIFDDASGWVFREGYAGTSGATSIVGGVATSLQGMFKASGLEPGYLSSKQMRQLLINTGTAQAGDLTQHIGPFPDLQAAYLQVMLQGAGLIYEPWYVSCGEESWTPPEFSISSGMVETTQPIEIELRFGGGVYIQNSAIYYTMDGHSEPNAWCTVDPECDYTFAWTLDDTLVSNSIVIDPQNLPVRIKARTATLQCGPEGIGSETVELVLAAQQYIAAPGMTVDGIELETRVQLTSGIGPQTNIRYTLDGTEPSDEGNIWEYDEDGNLVPGAASPLWSDCYTNPSAHPDQCSPAAQPQFIDIFTHDGLYVYNDITGFDEVTLRATVFKDVGFNLYVGGEELCVVFPVGAAPYPCP